MRSLTPPGRAAEEFASVLDGTASPELRERYAAQLRTLERLSSASLVTPRPAFTAGLREQLLVAAETELVAAPDTTVRRLHPREQGRTSRRLGTVAATLVIVGGTAGMAAAAGGALPGEALYPVKRGTEQVGTALSLGDAAKGRSLLGQAATRLDEARDLQRRGADDADVAAAVDASRTTADAGAERLLDAYDLDADDASITRLRDFTATQMRGVDDLATDASPSVAAALVDAADALADLDQAARVRCDTCGPAGAVELPQALAQGAGAATVESLLARPVAQALADREAVRALETAQIVQLRRIAQQRAGELGDAPASVRDALPVVEGTAHGPVASTLTAGDAQGLGGLLSPEGPVTGIVQGPVTQLVTGVTGTVQQVTGTVPKTGTPLDQPVQDLTDTVDGITGGVLP